MEKFTNSIHYITKKVKNIRTLNLQQHFELDVPVRQSFYVIYIT